MYIGRTGQGKPTFKGLRPNGPSNDSENLLMQAKKISRFSIKFTIQISSVPRLLGSGEGRGARNKKGEHRLRGSGGEAPRRWRNFEILHKIFQVKI